MFSQIFATYDETIVSTLEHYNQDFDADSHIFERVIDIIHLMPFDCIPKIENVREQIKKIIKFQTMTPKQYLILMLIRGVIAYRTGQAVAPSIVCMG